MSVIDIFESKIKEDKRPREALQAIIRFKNGDINKEQLDEARRAADAAVYTAYAAHAYAVDAYTAAYADAYADAANAADVAAYWVKKYHKLTGE
jgi:hypothetical protein